MEKFNLSKRPKMTVAHNSIKEVANKISSDKDERIRFLTDPSKYIEESSLGTYDSCDLVGEEYLQTSEACTAIAACVAAVVVGVVAVSGAYAAIYVAQFAAVYVNVATSVA